MAVHYIGLRILPGTQNHKCFSSVAQKHTWLDWRLFVELRKKWRLVTLGCIAQWFCGVEGCFVKFQFLCCKQKEGNLGPSGTALVVNNQRAYNMFDNFSSLFS